MIAEVWSGQPTTDDAFGSPSHRVVYRGEPGGGDRFAVWQGQNGGVVIHYPARVRNDGKFRIEPGCFHAFSLRKLPLRGSMCTYSEEWSRVGYRATEMSQRSGQKPESFDRADQVRWWLFSLLQIIMALGLVLAVYERQWLTAVVTLAIILVMFLPTALARRIRLEIPAEYEMMAVVFVFASIFLGEVRGYYHRFWWWDIALHTLSGLLLGIFGFLLVYVLNASDRIDLQMRPRFVAFFAFLFAVAVGAIWEIVEFAMDQFFGMNMQKAMFDDPSGLTDTMWDLIVDTIGALIISLLGWWHMHRRRSSFIDAWIRKFVARNPHLFRR